MLIEYKFFIRTSTKQGSSSVANDQDEDDDVRAERLRIMSLEKKPGSKERDEVKDYLKIIKMSKVYSKMKNFKTKKNLAVDSLCVGIDNSSRNVC